ncbi:MAG TPA: phenylacetate-CoA oxygenase/reductase subunit PaaK [Flavilitoribacter sp.]|nr:phenylacetate-CoA oxygenase/reductase subunit PaaK [Flavilitoribacter sp.]HMQ86061.1 phenylacetate-CoA oxygenase/reductase subunit PaaK [Flavilitoribacter sp.]
MSRFYPLRVKDIRKETGDCVSVSLEVPAELKDAFSFTPGQYLTFRIFEEGKEVRRSYSICSSPYENEWRVAVKRIASGSFTTFVHDELKIGDTLEVMPPMGHFVHVVDPAKSGLYLAFAAGSGITPVMSILKSVLTGEANSKFILFYGNRNTENIIFREEIEGLKNQHLERFSVHYVLSQEHTGSELFSGRIDADRCRRFMTVLVDPADVEDVFLCGPFEMIQDLKGVLPDLGVPLRKIHHELFTTGGKLPPKPAKVENSPDIESIITIRLDGATTDFPLNSRGESILEAALKAGADLPFSCKGGVCSTCRAKLIEGSVDMDVNWALEQDELEDGYILTCQSHPKTSRVTVDFDV